ncbi:EAL domain-containing protein [Pleionea sp. CnH1-48]|uniref:EAL domain-containing protein n=1 Tax=Pleionea sp. CnH1-48 TaxID=2954494 RepID=UPI002097CDC2|nr:EAL domain-containing protein [Pleionea sp. CnH1-48]MCO7224883.1 EAL domain-containing protein [Pleionea sp. CnH1-48]
MFSQAGRALLSRSLLRLAILFVSINLIFSYQAHALGELLLFQQLGKNKGLSQDSVIDMLRSRDGYLWIATQHGLNRYDGHNFKVFTHDRKNPRSISDNFIWSLAEDDNGYLWVGTRSGGLNRFDPKTETFIHYRHSAEDSHSISSDSVLEVFIDSQKRFWIGTANAGLNLFDPDTGKFKRIAKKEGESSGLNSNTVRVIKEADKGALWIGYSHVPLLRYPGAGLSLFNPETGINKVYGEEQGLKSEHVSDILKDNLGQTWVSTYGGGLHLFDVKLEKLTSIPLHGEKSKLDSRISNMQQGQHNTLWVSMMSDGVLEMNSKTKESFIHKASRQNLSLPDNSVSYLLTSDSLLWVGTWRAGLNLTDIASRRFGKMVGRLEQDNELPDPRVSYVSAHKNSDIWIANNVGIARYTQNMEQKDFFWLEELTPCREAKTVRTVFADSSNNIWFACDQIGVFSMPVSADKKEMLANIKDYRPLIDDKRIVAIYELEPNIYVIGTRNKGVYWLNTAQESVRHFMHDPDDPNSISGNAITKKGFLKDPVAGGLWIATVGTGLNFWDFGSGEFEHYTIERQGLSHNSITSVLLSGSDRMWVGTQGGGMNLLQWTGKRGQSTLRPPKVISTHEGLGSDAIGAIMSSKNGDLWVSTTQGISWIREGLEPIINFDTQDGVLERYSIGVGFKNYDGRLFFGGFKGLSFFEPTKIESEGEHLPLVFNELLINNKPAILSNDLRVSPLKTELLEYTSELKFHYSIKNFTLSFSSLDMINQKKVQYAYRLRGFDKNWLFTDSERRYATYTNIAPGQYVFELISRNRYGVWLDKPKELHVEVFAAPWFSWWAYLLYCLSALSIVLLFGYQRYRTQKEIRKSERQLRLALWGSGEELWDWDIKTSQVTRTNRLVDIELGDSMCMESIVRESSPVHHKDQIRIKAALEDYLNGSSESYEVVYRVVGKDGTWRWLLERGRTSEVNEVGEPVRMTGMLKDISDIKSTEEQLRLIAAAFENTSDGIWIIDLSYRIVFVNKAYRKITGYDSKHVVGRKLSLKSHEEDVSDLEDRIKKETLETGQWQGEIWDTRKNGEFYPVELSIDSIRDEYSAITHYVGVFSDITSRKRFESELRRMANYDELTSLPNRNLFYDRVNHAIERMDRKRKKLSLLFIDVDQFKKINDSLGHPIGDQLLCEVSIRISKVLKKSDSLSRFGGDEFCALVENVDFSSTSAKVAERIIESFQKPFIVESFSIAVTPSIGIVLYPNDGRDVDTLIKNADTAMYQAKKNGRNTFEFFTEELNHDAKRRLQMESELRDAVENEEFEVYYQPKVDVVSGKIIAMEALARWNSSSRGVVSPAEFIPIAEESGLIISLGRTILRKACIDTARWVEMGFDNLRVAVNLSAVQFRQHKKVLSTIKDALKESSLPEKNLELEITEGMVIDNFDKTIELMRNVQDLGVHISIDDFGTGYSSLCYLKQLPVNTLKIDRTFIKDLDSCEQDSRIVSSVITLAHGLGLNVVAEGVETMEQLQILKELKCDEIQGFLFSAPVPKGEFHELLLRQSSLPEIASQ